MKLERITDDIRRFVLTSIPSVPHLEALLMMRIENKKLWTGSEAARRLYVSEPVAAALLADLRTFGMLIGIEDEQAGLQYRYGPHSTELSRRIEQLAEVYTANLMEVTRLIHSKVDRNAQQFADAFTWRKDF